MPIYLTEQLASNEVGRVCKWAGPKIKAADLKEAEKKAEELNVSVIDGQEIVGWTGDTEWEGADNFCGQMSKAVDAAWLKEKTDG